MAAHPLAKIQVPPPPMHIDADHPEAREAYTRLANLVETHGGWLHPGLVVHQRGGELWASFEGEAAADEPLIYLAPPLLVPLAGLAWDDRAELELRDDGGLLTPLQREVLDAMLCLYRVTSKLAWARQHLPGLALAQEDPLRQGLARWHPALRSPASVAETFLASRCVEVTEGEARRDMLFALGEVLNHHPQGARLDARSDAGLRILRRGPANGAQCYTCYGFKDALDLLIGYGYADRGVRFVRSLPVEVELPRLGRLEIVGSGCNPGHDLPGVEHRPGQLRLSHLNFYGDKPGQSLSLIRIIVGALPLGLSGAEREALSLQAHEALVERNIEEWQQLQRLAQQVIDQGSPLPVHGMFAGLSGQQQQRIRRATAAS